MVCVYRHSIYYTPRIMNQPDTIAIIGVGLLGGSIAKAVQQRMPQTTVIGIGRDPAAVQNAQELGMLDEAGCNIELVQNADIVVVCTPVDRIAIDVRAAVDHLKSGAVITDVGSVKATIVANLTDLATEGRFVGSHPMAGSEKSGHQNAAANLFVDANCIVCPTEDAPANAVGTVTDLWTQLGATVTTMSAEAHDKVVAEISHLPHAIAAALAATPDDDALPFAATGFADTTRIAKGDADLWTAIFRTNREALLEALDDFEQKLSSLREAVHSDDEATRRLLEQARLRLG
jgi:prephenate dehydrogenase